MAEDTDRTVTRIDGTRFGQKIVAENGAGAAARIALGQMQADTTVVRQREGDRRVRQCDAFERFGAMRELGGFGLEELPPRRRVVVEVAHFDYGSGRQRGWFRFRGRFGAKSPGMIGFSLSAGQHNPRHRSYRGQRLAAKAERGDALQIVERGNFRGGVTCQRQRQFVTRNTATVVADAYQFDAAFLKLYLDRLTAGIKRVFEQFLEYRRRTFDDLACGNLADQQVGEKMNVLGGRHVQIIPAMLPVESRLSLRVIAEMEYLATFIDIVLHLDKYLEPLVAQYGTWIYAILFAIIFSETGFVVTPFLPGDSLLFVAGALAALGGINIGILIAVLVAAAALGNMLNYQIGRLLGPKVFQWQSSRFFNKAALEKTHAFYEKHGGKTLVISRFMPLFRTFAPFVAGIGAMTYSRFTFFNLIGAVSWVVSLTLAGYFFGNLPWVQQNLTAVILGIIAVSMIPVVVGWWQQRKA